MSQVFEEGQLRFEFGDSWWVEKYDHHRDYRRQIGKLENTGAVDFVALREAAGESRSTWCSGSKKIDLPNELWPSAAP